MKYFKMRESKRKISFIMALALIVSLLPVSPVVKAASGDSIKVYVDNQVTGTTAEVNAENGNGNGNVTLTLKDVAEADKDSIKVTSEPGTKDTVVSCSAIATGSATGSEVVVGKPSYASGVLTWLISGLTGNTVLTITKTSDPTSTPTPAPTETLAPTKAPSMAASVSAISDEDKEEILNSGKTTLTDEEKALVKAGDASLELKPTNELASVGAITDAEKTAINSLNVDAKTKEAISKFMGTPERTFVFDLKMILMYVKDGVASEKGNITEFKKAVEIEMELPEAYRNAGNADFFVVRIHEDGGKVTVDVLPCTVTGNKFKFESDKFSKFILCYKDKVSSGSTARPWLSGTATPTPTPSATATPSANPSASAVPSATPVATTVPTGTDKPTDGTTGGDNTPGVTEPGDGNNGTDGGNSSTSGSSSKIKKGQKYTVNGIKYEIISTDSTKTVGFVNGKKNAKKITIPATVKIKGKTFKVKSIEAGAFKNNKKLTTVVIGANVKIIGKNAFKGCSKVKKITIKSKKLTAAKVAKNAFKGINKNATVKVPKNKVKAYTKIVKTKGGAGSSVKVTK